MASAMAKPSRDQPRSSVIGSRKMPDVERAPKVTMAMKQPATMMTGKGTGTARRAVVADIIEVPLLSSGDDKDLRARHKRKKAMGIITMIDLRSRRKNGPRRGLGPF